jgi:hypothetical protein
LVSRKGEARVTVVVNAMQGIVSQRQICAGYMTEPCRTCQSKIRRFY